jgi:hypothetical protein
VEVVSAAYLLRLLFQFAASFKSNRQLADWFEELEEEAWDRQMEQDFAPGGRGAHLLEEVNAAT